MIRPLVMIRNFVDVLYGADNTYSVLFKRYLAVESMTITKFAKNCIYYSYYSSSGLKHCMACLLCNIFYHTQLTFFST